MLYSRRSDAAHRYSTSPGGDPRMLSDIEIAHQTTLSPIIDIAAKLDLKPDDLELYGPFKAKVGFDAIRRADTTRELGKLILVTAMTPTPAGEGKTTLAIGLSQALWKLGKRNVLAIREPSLGPVFGLKGGATGGGYAQVLPMEDINLHFTGDFHAVTAANNLLCALIDSHLHHGNALGIDQRTITLNRVLDVCDRSLRNSVIGLGAGKNGVVRETGFEITAASEIMGILALSLDLADLKARLARIVVGLNSDEQPVTAADLNAVGAMAATLKDAIKPNLVQTVEGTPALVHAGPFGNVSFGCNSVIATRLGLRLGEYLVTEAGFGSDLGGEKFINIKCRTAGFMPSAVVIAATIRALKYQGGVELARVKDPNTDALAKGMPNLFKHIENVEEHGLHPVVGLNRFESDTDQEIELVRSMLSERGIRMALVDVWAKGGEGGRELAELIVEQASKPCAPRYLYEETDSISKKIEKVATRIYGAASVTFALPARKKLQQIESQGFGNLPVCIAKTQNSISDQASLKGRPDGFTINIRDLKVNAGAGYVVAYAGEILTMPGMSANPAAHGINLTDNGEITGIF